MEAGQRDERAEVFSLATQEPMTHSSSPAVRHRCASGRARAVLEKKYTEVRAQPFRLLSWWQ